MKRHWLRGTLLGVSLALLLMGGVALAQGTLTADKECVECVPNRYLNVTPAEIPYGPYGVTIRGADWTPDVSLHHELRWPDGSFWTAVEGAPTDASGRFTWLPGGLAFWCECEPEMQQQSGYGPGTLAVAQVNCPEMLGEMEFYFSDPRTQEEASVYVLLARVCGEQPVEEFVPEPGTIALLGSGLAGLAGYGTLRWRSRH